jgi:next-to-BRCA1 protein 1
MATPSAHLGPEHLVTVKVLYNDSNRRFKLPLKDLKAQVFPQMVSLHSSSDRTSSSDSLSFF